MEYSQADIDMMRRDAMRRTREMHSRAIKDGSSEMSGKEEESGKNDEKAKKNTAGIDGIPFLGDLLPGLEIDSDKLIILVLIMILAKEGADLKLLLALFYIMM